MSKPIPRVPSGDCIKHHKNFWWDDSSPLIHGDFHSQFKYGWVRVFLTDIEPAVIDILKYEAATGKFTGDYGDEQRLLRFDHENCLYQALPTNRNPLFALWILHLIETYPRGIDISACIAFFTSPLDELVCLPPGPQIVHLL